MIKCTLYKAILKSRNTPVITLSIAMVGIYVGYLTWYIVNRYLPEPISSYRVLVAILTFWICAFVAIYKIPDQLFTNRRIKDVLCFPVSVDKLVSLVIGRLACFQFGMVVCGFWAYFLYASDDWLLTITILLGCWICSCLIDLLVLVLFTAIGNLLPASIVGYGFILFQYGAFLLLALSVGNLVTKIFFWSGYLENLNGIFNPVQWLLIVILPMILLAVCTSFFVKAKYIRGYLNTQNFQYRRTDKAIAPTKIQNPYFLLEWKRVSRNKELIFFSNIKNILTVFVLFSLLVQNFEWIGLSEKYALELFLLVSCCAVNTISSTAYSSDPNKSYFSFLPISAHRLFFWKTIQGFLWGELTVLLFGVGVILFRNIPILDACLLLGYGTATNYSCVWIGVFLDYKMPRTPNSTNKLLHGNISKVLVLFVSIALTVWEIYFSTQISGSISLLLFAVCISVCIVMIELGYLIFYRRAFRD